MGTDEINDNRAISEKIALLMVRVRLRSNAELARQSGINRATISLKMNGRRRWTIEDLRLLAPVLGTTVSHLLGDEQSQDLTSRPREIRRSEQPLDRAVELRRRVRFLLDHSEDPMNLEGETDIKVALAGGRASSDPTTLRAIAARFDVPMDYLLELDDSAQAERVEAQIELGAALTEGGVINVASRSLGQLSADELNAITRIIREYRTPPRGSDEESGGD